MLRSEEEPYRGELEELIAESMVEVRQQDHPVRHAKLFGISEIPCPVRR